MVNEVDGIGLGIFNSDVFQESICVVEEVGIIVIVFNVDNFGGVNVFCCSVYVGQDDVVVGVKLVQCFVKEFEFKEGDLVLVLVELLEVIYVVKCFLGIKFVFEFFGIIVDVVCFMINLGEVQIIIFQYLFVNLNIKVIIVFGQILINVVFVVMVELGMDILFVGFDLFLDIVNFIKFGVLIVIVDQ